MAYIQRHIEQCVAQAAEHFPAIVCTGPRRSGKTTLLRHLFPKAQYCLLEDPDIVGRVRADPRAFMEGLRPPVILDEIQNAPELFDYVRTRIDAAPDRPGEWLFTGSQEAPLMRGVTESMAGRAAVFQLLPFSTREDPRVSLVHGGFPEVLAKPTMAQLWFSSYTQTYLERDVRAVTAVRDLTTFRRFIALLAARNGQTLNRTDIAAPLGIAVPTVSSWLSVLEVTGQILLVPPYFENFGKRITRSPKVYFVDSGLACYLLGIDSEQQLLSSPFAGAVFEGFVASEIVKAQANAGRRRELYFFRDQQGLEVDFVVPCGAGTLALVEAKCSRTAKAGMERPMVRLRGAIGSAGGPDYLVYRPSTDRPEHTNLAPGVQAVSLSQLLDRIVPSRPAGVADPLISPGESS